jgi:hypothetical protein
LRGQPGGVGQVYDECQYLCHELMIIY